MLIFCLECFVLNVSNLYQSPLAISMKSLSSYHTAVRFTARKEDGVDKVRRISPACIAEYS
jgi:hypothetical protein